MFCINIIYADASTGTKRSGIPRVVRITWDVLTATTAVLFITTIKYIGIVIVIVAELSTVSEVVVCAILDSRSRKDKLAVIYRPTISGG